MKFIDTYPIILNQKRIMKKIIVSFFCLATLSLNLAADPLRLINPAVELPTFTVQQKKLYKSYIDVVAPLVLAQSSIMVEGLKNSIEEFNGEDKAYTSLRNRIGLLIDSVTFVKARDEELFEEMAYYVTINKLKEKPYINSDLVEQVEVMYTTLDALVSCKKIKLIDCTLDIIEITTNTGINFARLGNLFNFMGTSDDYREVLNSYRIAEAYLHLSIRVATPQAPFLPISDDSIEIIANSLGIEDGWFFNEYDLDAAREMMKLYRNLILDNYSNINKEPFSDLEPLGNSKPYTPLLEIDGGITDISLTPTFRASAFNDPDEEDTHIETWWGIIEIGKGYIKDFGWSTSNKYSIQVPSGILEKGKQYKAVVAFKDNHDNYSNGRFVWFETKGDPNNRPERPTIEVVGGTTNVPLEPTLRSSEFIDADSIDYHAQTWWGIKKDGVYIWQTDWLSADTQITIPEGMLDEGTDYTAAVAYKDNRGKYSLGGFVDFRTKYLDDTVSNDFYLSSPDTDKSSIQAGGTVEASIEQKYLGNSENSLSVYVGYYLSRDKVLDSNDIELGDDISSLSKSITASNENQELTIPDNTEPGSYYILFVADYKNEHNEVNEKNNVEYMEIRVLDTINTEHDLFFEEVTVDKLVIQAGGKLSLYSKEKYSGTFVGQVKNRISYYLSSNQIFNPSEDVLLGDDTAYPENGDSDSEREEVTIPSNTSEGSYHILFVADSDDDYQETNENNNIDSIAIEVKTGDDFSISALSIDQNSIYPRNILEYDVTTFLSGTSPTIKRPMTGIFLSKNKTFESGTDIFVDQVGVSLSVSPGENSDFEQRDERVKIPDSLEPGIWHVLAVTDHDNLLPEINEGNNVKWVEIEVLSPGDFYLSGIGGTMEVSAGDEITVSGTVTYVGNNEQQMWPDMGCYLSSDQILDSTDAFIEDMGVHVDKTEPTDNIDRDVEIPGRVSTGIHYLLCKLDFEDRYYETDETNNIGIIELNVKLGNDFYLSNTTAPEWMLYRGERFEAWIEGHYRGNSDNSLFPYIEVFLSNDTLLSTDDTPILIYEESFSLKATKLWEQEHLHLELPKDMLQGEYYLIFKIDHNNEYAETDETNNIVAVKIGVEVEIDANSDRFYPFDQKIWASDREVKDYFGENIAVDGDWLVASASYKDYNSIEEVGAVYVFKKSTDGIWEEYQKLYINDPLRHSIVGFKDISISNNTIVAGSATQGDGSQDNLGAIYIFTLAEGVWTQTQKLFASEKQRYSYFGYKHDIDNDTLAVGAYNMDKENKDNLGVVYIFTKNGSEWTQAHEVLASDGLAGDGFGRSVHLSGDSLVVSNTEGYSYIFKYINNSWEEMQKIETGTFTTPISISGNTLVVGRSIYKYSQADNNWSLHSSLSVSEKSYDSVDISKDEETIILGDEDGVGQAYVFRLVNDQWELFKTLFPGPRGSTFGCSVALSDNGEFVAVGDSSAGVKEMSSAGAVYLYRLFSDSDDDGHPDNEDAFPNDPDEWQDTDSDGTGNNADSDDDNDGMPDDYELSNGLNPLDPSDANLDSDSDGYTNLQEYQAGTDPRDPDDKPGYVVKNDFNHDGTSDVLWVNATDNKTYIWYMHADGTHSAIYKGRKFAGYEAKGAGDFNADGFADILWVNATDNKTYIWYMQADGSHTTTYTGKTFAGYEAKGTGNFDAADGTIDILWVNAADNKTYIWYMYTDNTHTATYSGQSFAGYEAKGTGDFNNDGTPDVLWVNPTDRKTYIWYMNSDNTHTATYSGKSFVGYEAKGTGDFNADGTSDILWVNATDRKTYIWYMDTDGSYTSTYSGKFFIGYEAKSTGNYNADGSTDILWVNPTDNKTYIWYMHADNTHTTTYNGKTFSGYEVAP